MVSEPALGLDDIDGGEVGWQLRHVQVHAGAGLGDGLNGGRTGIEGRIRDRLRLRKIRSRVVF